MRPKEVRVYIDDEPVLNEIQFSVGVDTVTVQAFLPDSVGHTLQYGHIYRVSVGTYDFGKMQLIKIRRKPEHGVRLSKIRYVFSSTFKLLNQSKLSQQSKQIKQEHNTTSQQ